ncbi:MAG: DUF4129 domain-containing protein [Planctomycetota bacterium]
MTPRQVARNLRSFVFARFWSTLLFGRLAFHSRTIIEPVVLLERLTGRPRKERIRLLFQGGTRGRCWRLAQGISLLETCMVFAAAMLFPRFWPTPMESDQMLDMQWFEAGLGLQFGALFLLWTLGMFIESLWTATGFSLYLNRRGELEGWDVELALRVLARRAGRRDSRLAAWLLPLWLLLPLGPGLTRQTGTSGRDAQEVVEEVYSRPELRTEQQVQVRLGGEPRFSEIVPLVMWLGWILFGLLVLWFLYLLLRWSAGIQGSLGANHKAAPPGPEVSVAGLDLRATSLPADPLTFAGRLWADGEHRAALSLLYRAALVLLRDRHGLELESGDTETSALRKAGRLGGDPAAPWFAVLTGSWQAIAYADRTPEQAEFEQLLGLLREPWGRA